MSDQSNAVTTPVPHSRAATIRDYLVERAPWRRPHLRWLTLILLVALALRVTWIAAVQPDPRDGRLDDSAGHYIVAQSLVDGEGFALDGAGTPTAVMPPGYPSVLAAVFLLPGDDVATGRALNVVLGVALVAGVYYLGSRLWDRRAGLIAAGIMALFPSSIFFSSLLMKEPLGAALVVGVLSLAVAWTMGDEVSPWRVVALGVAVAFTGYVRPEGFALAAVILVAWALLRRNRRQLAAHTALLVLGMALLMVPWTVRNEIQIDAPIVTATGGGLILYESHQPESGGRGNVLLPLKLALRFQDVPLPEREVQIYNAGIREARSYAVRHIPRELSLAPQRLAWFFRGDRDALAFIQITPPGKESEISKTWQDRWGMVADSYYYSTLGLMVLTVPFWLPRLRRRHALVLGPFAAYVAIWATLFVGAARYHFSLLAIFALLGAFGLSALIQSLSSRAEHSSDPSLGAPVRTGADRKR